MIPPEPVFMLAVRVKKYPTKKINNPTRVAVVALENTADIAKQKVMIEVNDMIQNTKRMIKLELSYRLALAAAQTTEVMR
jgi:hypothetical protein